jgi:hypothetical protein
MPPAHPYAAGASHSAGFRPGLPRVTWNTDHFTLTIDEKKQDLLPALANLAEECHAKQSAFFGYAPPGRIQMVFLDEGDYANGFAYSPQEWVVIHLHAAEHPLRGRTRWLQGVMSHEIGHIFTLRLMGQDSRFLGMDLFHDWYGKGGSTFEESFTWRYGQAPPWLAEGLAQYAAGVCGYDTLDSHRQMVLRVAAASGTLMTLAELKGFAWDSRRNEMIYAQGYSLVSYLYTTFGPKAANGYLKLAADHGWRGAFKPAFGKDIGALYRDWRKALETRYPVDENAGEGEFLLPEPTGIYTVETSPAPLSGNRFLYLSSADNDYGQTDLYLADGKGGPKEIFARATSVDASADGSSALFTATRYSFLQGDVVSDLYAFDAASGNVERLTTGGRIIRGCRSGGTVYGIRNNEGRTTVVKVEGGDWITVYVPPDSLEITDLIPGRTPATLTLGTTSGFGGDIRELDPASGELTPLAVSPQEERDPRWQGDTLYFSADYAGVFDIYALADENVIRCTQVKGGAFHPVPREDGIWVSSYGPMGFRLARMRRASEASAFMVQLPVPAWKPSAIAETEPDSYDRTSLGFLGFNLTLGVIRNPGFRQSFVDTATGDTHTFQYGNGTRGLTGVGFHWTNPSGLADADVNLGLSRPLDYEGPMHMDNSSFELRVNAFLPTLVVGGYYSTFDLPDVRQDSLKFHYYYGYLNGYAGLDWRLAEHWSSLWRFVTEENSGYQGRDGDFDKDSDLKYGGSLQVAYADIESGKDGVIRGFSSFVRGEKPAQVNARVPDFSATAGATAYASLGRLLFLDASLYHTEDFGDAYKGWVYGGASAYCAIPLGMQLGTRGGAGLYLDQAYPGIEYREMSRLVFEPGNDGAGYGPRAGGMYPMYNLGLSHEVGFTLSLKTLTFFPHPEVWVAGLRFDAADFGKEPVWSVSISL